MRFRKVFQLIQSDLSKRFSITGNVNPLISKYLAQLKRDGICIIPDYWSFEKCLETKKYFEKMLQAKEDSNYSSGSYIRHNKGKTVNDQGVTRIYHADKEFHELQSFRFDPLILGLAEKYYRKPMYSNFIALQYNLPSESGTREYHVDWWQDEFKAFLYLDNVDISAGPFAYLAGSHSWCYPKYKKLLADHSNEYNTSFSESELGNWLKKEKIITAPAGTLILADVSGLHRGLPQVSQTRSLLYNNLFSKNTELYPQLTT